MCTYMHIVSQGLMGHISRSMRDSGAERDVNYEGLAQEVSGKKIISTY